MFHIYDVLYLKKCAEDSQCWNYNSEQNIAMFSLLEDCPQIEKAN